MKKYLLAVFIFLLPSLSLADGLCYTVSGAGTSAVNGDYTTYGSQVYSNGTVYLRYAAAGAFIAFSNLSSGGNNTSRYYTNQNCNFNSPDIDAGLQCIIDNSDTFTHTSATLGADPVPSIALCTPVPLTTSFEDNITNAFSVYNATLGVSMASTTEWTTQNLLNLFLGSGLALLYYMRGWIVALILIAAIVYFAYRGFRFFRH